MVVKAEANTNVPSSAAADTAQLGMAKSGAFTNTTLSFGAVDDGSMTDTMDEWDGGGWLQASGIFTPLRSIPIQIHISLR